MSEHPTPSERPIARVPIARVPITLDGRPANVPVGRSLAAALIELGLPVTRLDRSGRPRAPYCAMGVCFECVVTVDDVPLVRACQEPTRAGMVVATGVPAPDTDTDTDPRETR